MKKWNFKEQAATPGGGVIALFEHDGSYSIRLNGLDLMSTRRHASEELLATLTCGAISKKKGACVLIGGLGLGFTLRAALATVGKDAQIIVAELIPAVVAWNRNPDYHLAADALADKRVQVVERDVADLIREGALNYDAILIDVDNGPAGFTVDTNDRLYSQAGLQYSKQALRPGGCLGIWSAQAAPEFSKLMIKVGFKVKTHRAPTHPNSGLSHTLFLGHKSTP